MADDDSKLVAFRFPVSLVERLDAYVEQLQREQPGLKVDRSGAVRTLLIKVLDELGVKAKRRTK